MKKSNYKKISKGNARPMKRDLDVIQYLSHHRNTKKWMKQFLSRYERRRGKKESQNSSDEI